MKNRLNIIKCLLIIFVSALMFSGCSLIDVLFPAEEVETYSFSGYVYADDLPLHNATVSCGLSEVTTDEKGYYSFSGLSKVVGVTVSKDGYYFDNTLTYVKSNRNDVNFDGYKYFEVNGTVKIGNEVVSNALVSVTSNAGSYTTNSNSDGNFYLSNLAGKASVTASLEGVDFFTQECDKETDYIEINTSLDINCIIKCDFLPSSEDFVLKLNNEVVDNAINVNGENEILFNLFDIKPKTSLVLESANYYIDNPELIINSGNTIEFNCKKYYSSTITAVSGNSILDEAKLYIDDEEIIQNKQDKTIILEKLYGTHKISASLNGFNFSDVTINYNNKNAEMVGTFNLEVEVITDSKDFEDIKISLNNTETDVTESKIVFNNIQLDSVIKFNTNNYYVNDVEDDGVIVSSIEPKKFILNKFYNLSLSATYNDIALPETVVKINDVACDKLSTEGALFVYGLYGINKISLLLDNYKFEDYEISLDNCNDNNVCVISAVAKKLFNISGTVYSGETKISGAEVSVVGLDKNKYSAITAENGKFEITGLYDAGRIEVSKSKYNTTIQNFAIENEEFNVYLTYNVSGVILCGSDIVSNVEVTSGKSKAVTNENGEFLLKDLQGTAEINFAKDFYNFTKCSVANEDEIEVLCTYIIRGTLTGKVDEVTGVAEKLGGVKVVLIKNDSQEETFSCNEDGDNFGTFEFSTFNGKGLTGSYLLLCDSKIYDLRPKYRIVNAGGEYNFSDGGYKISGKITCGGIPVKDVAVRVDNQIQYTNEDGIYEFALITKSNVVVTPEKLGYVFTSTNAKAEEDASGQLITSEDDERTDINFTSTYKVSGYVSSGNTALEGAVVRIGEKSCTTLSNGYYEISGITGNASISASLLGYHFVGKNLVQNAQVVDFKGFYTQSYKILTGDIEVVGVKLQAKGETYTSGNGGIIIIQNAEIGTSFTLSKQGYNFTNSTFSGFSSSPVEINCSYNVYGRVLSGVTGLENVLIKVNGEQKTFSNNNGNFELLELVGQNELSFSLQDFEFDQVSVTSPANVNVYAKYSITGVVTTNGKPLGNVKVTGGSASVFTNGAGLFTINGLSTEVTLILEKEGYEFTGSTFTVNSTCNLEFTASYLIRGYVSSGEIMIEGVLVTSSLGWEGVKTDIEGYYEIKGQEGEVTLTFEKDGYGVVEKQISKYSQDPINVNLSYSITINFTGTQDFSGIYISLNANSKEYPQSSVTLENLEGYNTISFFKTGCAFNPKEIGVSGYKVYNVTITKYYSAKFKVQTSFGLIKDAEVMVDGKLATLNEDGLYEAEELTGTVSVSANFNVTNSSGKNLFSYSATCGTGSISNGGIYEIDVDNNEYAFFMFTRAYQRLRDSYAYKITVSGTVTPHTDLAGEQKVGMTYKKVGNERLYENLNYGKGAADVEPRVSLLTYVNFAPQANEQPVWYQMPKGDKIKSDLTADYDMNWTKCSYQEYSKKYGIAPDGFFPYNLTKESLQKGSISTIVYNSSQKTYTFNFNFGGGGSVVDNLVIGNYQTLMNEMVKGQTTQSYNYVYLTFTFDEFGNILELKTDEEYKVFAVIVTTTTDGKMTYTYSTSNNTSTTPINKSSNDSIRKSLQENLPENIRTSIKNISTCVLNKRRELV